jgi:hypothetical protein
MKKIQAKMMTMIKMMMMILNKMKAIIIVKREDLNQTKTMKLRNHTELKE